jgi:hypothetical protein
VPVHIEYEHLVLLLSLLLTKTSASLNFPTSRHAAGPVLKPMIALCPALC